MQLEEDPSISQVANRFMGTGLLSAPLPGKLRRPLLSAMVRAAGGTVRHRAAGGDQRKQTDAGLFLILVFPVRVSANAQRSAM